MGESTARSRHTEAKTQHTEQRLHCCQKGIILEKNQDLSFHKVIYHIPNVNKYITMFSNVSKHFLKFSSFARSNSQNSGRQNLIIQ